MSKVVYLSDTISSKCYLSIIMKGTFFLIANTLALLTGYDSP